MTRPTLLLGEDQRDVATSLVRLLGDVFDVVAVVSDGEALIERAGLLQPDVIVTDVGLQRVDGISAASEIRRRGPSARIVVISGCNDPALHEKRSEAAPRRSSEKSKWPTR
jgi:DNA-binding NarL/FixJ family response regulator